jgi:RNA polymerase sigma factor (sigma-70 family)
VDTRARALLIAEHTRYAQKLASAVYRRVRLSFHDRQELAQDAIVGLILAVDDFDPSILSLENFRFYARHRILGHVKDCLAAILNVRDHETSVGLKVPEATETADRDRIADDVWSAIRRLSPFEAYVVIMSDGLDGRRRQSAREISEECGLSAARIRVVRATAHRRMAERLAARRRA